MTDLAARRAAFRKLHESGCFLLPNPWDVGSARYLRGLGFKALATTSAGFAFSSGLPDADWDVPRDKVLQHIAEIGVRRISVGSALARAAWTGFIHAAREMAERNSMAGLDDAVSFAELNGFFRKDLAERS